MTREEAEIEKILAEKKNIESERTIKEANARRWWHRAVISGVTFGATGFGVLVILYNISYTQLKEASQLEIDRKTFQYEEDMAGLYKLEESNAEKQFLLDQKQSQLDELTAILDSVLGNKAAYEAAVESGEIDVEVAMDQSEEISRIRGEIKQSDKKIKEVTPPKIYTDPLKAKAEEARRRKEP